MEIFKLLYAAYCLAKEIYLWQREDSKNMNRELRGKVVFTIYALVLVFSLTLNVGLSLAIVRLDRYLNAYVSAAFSYIEYKREVSTRPVPLPKVIEVPCKKLPKR